MAPLGPWAVIALLVALPILWSDWKRAGVPRQAGVRSKQIVAGLVGLAILCPVLAHAHGDDSVTLATFFGPMLGLVVLVSVVGIGRAVIRAARGHGP